MRCCMGWRRGLHSCAIIPDRRFIERNERYCPKTMSIRTAFKAAIRDPELRGLIFHDNCFDCRIGR